MILREAEVRVEAGWVNDLVLRSLRKKNELAFGSSAWFDPFSLFVGAYPPNIDTDGPLVTMDALYAHLKRGLRACTSFDQRLGFLLAETAWLHELRHFHDAICCPAGWMHFVAEWDLYWHACTSLLELAKSDQVVDRPLARYAGADAPSGPLKEAGASAATNVLNAHLYRFLHFGDMPPERLDRVDGESDIVWFTCNQAPLKGLRIPTFPSLASVDGAPAGLAIPVGFRALSEYAAVVVQNYVISDFGRDYYEAFEQQLRGKGEYIAANMMCTRAFKHNHRDKRFRTWDHVFQIIQAAMARTERIDLTHSVGCRFVEELDHAATDGDGYFATCSNRHAGCLKAFAAQARQVAYADHSGDGYFYRVRDFVLQECIQPAIELVAAQPNGAACDSASWYVTHSTRLPQPPFSLRGSKLAYDRQRFGDRPGDDAFALLIALWMWVMMRRTLDEATVGMELSCAVHDRYAAGPFQGGAAYPDQHCEEGIAGRSCGRCKIGDDLSGHVACPWRHLVIELRLVRGPGGAASNVDTAVPA